MVRDSASRVLHHWYILGDDIEYLLRNTINDRLRVGGHTVPQNCRVSPLEENAKPSPEVGDGFPLRLPSVSCQATAQLLHLPLCCGVPPTH